MLCYCSEAWFSSNIPKYDGSIPAAAEKEIWNFGVPEKASDVFAVAFEDSDVLGFAVLFAEVPYDNVAVVWARCEDVWKDGAPCAGEDFGCVTFALPDCGCAIRIINSQYPIFTARSKLLLIKRIPSHSKNFLGMSKSLNNIYRLPIIRNT